MSNLNVDHKTIKDVLSGKNSNFLIPDYQRPYSWTEKEWQKLWDDIFQFAIPDNDYTKFRDEEYFLGPIVTFRNDKNMLEVIDGQQRLTTLLILLRVFYSKMEHMSDSETKQTRAIISKCIWQTNELEQPIFDKLRIESQVASDEDRNEFINILKNGNKEEYTSRYSKAYRFYEDRVNEFLDNYSIYLAYFPPRILNNCILLPIEADSQDTALRIFSTLNDRGKPLSDTDIFKSKFYQYYSQLGKKDEFIKRWKIVEEKCNKIFSDNDNSSMDELFTRYMYYLRAKLGIRDTTTKALRKFYEENDYAELKKEETFSNLEELLEFWDKVYNQDEEFDEAVLKSFSILNYAPNSMWTYIVSVYFMKYKNETGELNQNELLRFLNKIIAFIWGYAIVHPGVNSLRTPLYPAMINIVNNEEVNFSEYKFEESTLKSLLDNYEFTNQRPITKSMLVWWTYQNDAQKLLPNSEKFDIEHIFSKKRQESEKTLQCEKNLESIGNKAILEKRINIRASDYRFEDKVKYYKGYITTKGKRKEKTQVLELISISKNKDFTESNIVDRKNDIINTFVKYLKEEELLIF